MKLKATIVAEWDIERLEDYNAKTIQEAANSTQRQIDEGEVG